MDAEPRRWRILRSAHRHGIPAEDILHAYRNITWTIPQDDCRITLVGPRRDGDLLEVGVEYDAATGTDLIIHAMRVRSKYMRQHRGSTR
ncbi:hypothetical protein [Candidatus Poriferisodalis sp.]|uniref:hypothetical protein n=1 Tax=Candidatus Poriferisodalis sp. TaxID=3101277 RepID=UPI003B51DF48